jgi:hypothetical protein
MRFVGKSDFIETLDPLAELSTNGADGDGLFERRCRGAGVHDVGSGGFVKEP